MQIRWTEPAAGDLTSICDYIQSQDGIKIARRVALEIYRRITRLSDFPNQGREGRRQGARELVFSGLPYVAVYRVQGNAIEILRILHGAQQFPG